MADEAYYLGREDREKFLALWRDYTSRRAPQPRHPDRKLPQTPEVYVARTPPGGIPALDAQGTGTSDDDSPGSATCDLYRIVQDFGAGTGTADDGPPSLRPTGRTKLVYNLSEAAVDGDAWVLVVRDKFGNWVASGGAGGDDHRWRMVRPTSENRDSDGYYPAYVQDWTGTAYANGDPCLIKLASGETLISGQLYEGEPLSVFQEAGTGTADPDDGLRIYGVCGNTTECAPDTCDPDTGDVTSWALLYHRAPFKIVRGYSESTCDDSGTGTGTG